MIENTKNPNLELPHTKFVEKVSSEKKRKSGSAIFITCRWKTMSFRIIGAYVKLSAYITVKKE